MDKIIPFTSLENMSATYKRQSDYLRNTIYTTNINFGKVQNQFIELKHY